VTALCHDGEKKTKKLEMGVRVKLYGDLRPRSGEAELGLILDGAQPTIDDTLQMLAAAKPELVDLLFDSRGDLKETINVFLNGVNARGLAEGESILSEGDTLFIITAFGGG